MPKKQQSNGQTERIEQGQRQETPTSQKQQSNRITKIKKNKRKRLLCESEAGMEGEETTATKTTNVPCPQAKSCCQTSTSHTSSNPTMKSQENKSNQRVMDSAMAGKHERFLPWSASQKHFGAEMKKNVAPGVRNVESFEPRTLGCITAPNIFHAKGTNLHIVRFFLTKSYIVRRA
jgi:hypothetical protein